MEIEVRRIAETEIDQLMALYPHLHADDVPPDAAKLRETWREICRNPDIAYFGAFVDGRMVSTCWIAAMPNLTRGCGRQAYLENVVTHPDFRGKGCGKAVVRHAVEYAWSRGCYKVMLLTGRKTDAVFNFYRSLGFSRDEKQAFILRKGRNDGK